MPKKKKKSGSRWKKFVIALSAIVLIFLLAIAFNFYLKLYAPSVSANKDEPYLYIPTGSSYDNLLIQLQQQHVVHSIEDFDWVARRMSLENNIHPGKYRIHSAMSNYALAQMLRSGKQEPVKLVINKFRLQEELCGFVSHKLEADSAVLFRSLNDSVYLRKFELKPREAMALFIPNTYEFFWNTSADQFLQRMKKEYDHFWTTERKELAAEEALTQIQVAILASIIEEETNYNPEKPRIAGVYLNRLHSGMKLQADPTVRFAHGNFSMRRVRFIDLDFDSDYNTYHHLGLPPGPICTPSMASVDAVLHAERNEYFYFCADPDKPGTHAFAKTFAQHQLNAKRYQNWLQQQGIRH